jgi:hypothetical protein
MAKKVIVFREKPNKEKVLVAEEPTPEPTSVPASVSPVAAPEEPVIATPKKEKSGFPIPVLIIFALIFGYLAVLVGASSVSPLYVGIQFGVNETDPSFFLYLGFSFNNGSLPYVGIYDQKGMYIYTFEALGYMLAGRNGVFTLLGLWCSIVSFALMMSVREMGAKKLGELLMGVTHMALIMAFKYGNHTGDLLMPWVALPILFYLMAINRKKEGFFFLGSFLAGVQAAFGLTSRPTEAIWGLSFVVFYFIYWLRNEKNLNLLWNALLAIVGLVIPVGIYSLMAYQGGYLHEMFYATVIQNFSYVGNHVYGVTLADQILTAIGVAFFLCLFFPIKKKRGLDIALFFVTMAVLAGGVNIYIARFPHYWLTGIPSMLLALFLAFVPVNEDALVLKGRKIYKGTIIALSSCAVIMSVLWPSLYYVCDKPLGLINNGEFSSTYNENKRTEANLDKYIRSSPTFEEDTVFALDGRGAAMLYLGKTSPERFACYTSWMAIDNPKIEPEVLTFLTGDDAPDWIIVSNDKSENVLPSFQHVLDNDYTVVCDSSQDNYLTIYEANAHR